MLGLGLLVVWFGLSLVVGWAAGTLLGNPELDVPIVEDVARDLDRFCNKSNFSCGVTADALIVAFVAILTYSVLVFWRTDRVVRRYLREARKSPQDLVLTAQGVGTVVGRRDFCEVLEADMRDRGRPTRWGFEYPTPRPQIILGGVGSGKTAVLVKLTQVLAERGAVPVPIRLRDARDSLHLWAMARENFLERVSGDLTSDDEGDRIWRQLCRRKSVVILGDGLEEALLDTVGRETEIRREIEYAQSREARLILTSRPDPAVLRIPAALVRLEPLTEQAAAEHVSERKAGPDVSAICKRAEVVEMPFYLRLARELNDRGALDGIDESQSTRLELRLSLLDRWMRCMIDRQVEERAQLNREERRAAVANLGVLARVALVHDSLELTFARYAESPFRARDPEGAKIEAKAGVQLGLAETLHDGIRFPHAVMQAYLASLALPDLLKSDEGEKYLCAALQGRPGRELFIALVMCCARPDNSGLRPMVRRHLRRCADERNDERGLGALAAEIEIASLRSPSGSASSIGPPDIAFPPWEATTEEGDVTIQLARIERRLTAIERGLQGTAGQSPSSPAADMTGSAPLRASSDAGADDTAPTELESDTPTPVDAQTSVTSNPLRPPQVATERMGRGEARRGEAAGDRALRRGALRFLV